MVEMRNGARSKLMEVQSIAMQCRGSHVFLLIQLVKQLKNETVANMETKGGTEGKTLCSGKDT